MTYALAALTLLVFGGVGWYAGRHRTSTATFATRIMLVAAAIAILVTHGPAQQVVASGLVGLVVGDLVAGFTMGESVLPGRGRRTD